ncbi:hypothetical protein TNCV_880911 [Trichonephila clavipes]|nr:hypothetical protein TNCV_880911 [Trichonephila clavipes]
MFSCTELLATDRMLNHGQVTWMTPELAPSNNHTTPTGKRFNSLNRLLTCIAALRRVFLVVLGSGFTRNQASHDPIPIPLGCRGQIQ